MPIFLHLKEFWKDTHITMIMLVLVRTAWGRSDEQTEDSLGGTLFSFINFFTFFCLFCFGTM